MQQSLMVPKTEIRLSSIHGYGGFAIQPIQQGEMIEECYCLVVSPGCESLANYVYQYEKLAVLPLGYGAIYNHANEPNAKVHIDEHRIMHITALRDIKLNEEILISYGKDWLEVRGLKLRESQKNKLWQKLIRPLFGIAIVLLAVVLLNYMLRYVTPVRL